MHGSADGIGQDHLARLLLLRLRLEDCSRGTRVVRRDGWLLKRVK